MNAVYLMCSLPTDLLKSPQWVKNATIVIFPPVGKTSPNATDRPVLALSTLLSFNKAYSGDDCMIEKEEDCIPRRPWPPRLLLLAPNLLSLTWPWEGKFLMTKA